MKVQIEDKLYSVEFEHGWIVPKLNYELISQEFAELCMQRKVAGVQGKDLRERTVCRIRDCSAPSPGDGTFPMIAQAAVQRNKKDTPNREKARKAALARAVLKLSVQSVDLPPIAGLNSNQFQEALDRVNLDRRNIRRLFWEAYFKAKQPQAQKRGAL